MLTNQEFRQKYFLNHESGIRDDKANLIMLWSPKAGCTTSCIMMFKHMGLLDEALKYSMWIHDYRWDVYYEKYGRINNNHLSSKKYFIFKVIRNPYNRIVSTYLHRFKTSSNDDFRKLSFEEFIKNIKINSGFFIIDNKMDYDITYHSFPQYFKDEEKIIDKYVYLENIKNDIDEINTLHNTNLDINIDIELLPHHTHHIDINICDDNKYLGNIPFDQLSIIPSSYKCFYNDLTKRLVEEIYFDDFSHYNYKFYD